MAKSTPPKFSVTKSFYKLYDFIPGFGIANPWQGLFLFALTSYFTFIYTLRFFIGYQDPQSNFVYAIAVLTWIMPFVLHFAFLKKRSDAQAKNPVKARYRKLTLTDFLVFIAILILYQISYLVAVLLYLAL